MLQNKVGKMRFVVMEKHMKNLDKADREKTAIANSRIHVLEKDPMILITNGIAESLRYIANH